MANICWEKITRIKYAVLRTQSPSFEESYRVWRWGIQVSRDITPRVFTMDRTARFRNVGLTKVIEERNKKLFFNNYTTQSSAKKYSKQYDGTTKASEFHDSLFLFTVFLFLKPFSSCICKYCKGLNMACQDRPQGHDLWQLGERSEDPFLVRSYAVLISSR